MIERTLDEVARKVDAIRMMSGAKTWSRRTRCRLQAGGMRFDNGNYPQRRKAADAAGMVDVRALQSARSEIAGWSASASPAIPNRPPTAPKNGRSAVRR